MGSVYVDSLTWLPKEDTDLQSVSRSLTVAPNVFIGEPEARRIYTETETHLGVPRAWGLQKLSEICSSGSVIDRTVYPDFDWPRLVFPSGGSYRSGQSEAIHAISDAFTRVSGALLEGKCSSGKTLMGLDIVSRLDTPALILVHKEDLAEQWHTTARTFFPGSIGGHVQGDTWYYSGCHYVTALFQTIFSRRDSLPPDFLECFGVSLFDEGHKVSCRTFEEVVRILPAKYRLGVSATWRRSDGLECIWNWHIGEIEWVVQVSSLVGEYVIIPWKTCLTDSVFRSGTMVNHSQWVSSIGSNIAYNQWLASSIVSGASAGRRVLVVSDRTSQLTDLHSRIQHLSPCTTVGMYVGSYLDLSGKSVKSSREDLRIAKGCDVILATYGMMLEGTDIPALDTLVFATPRVEIEQVVGRIQRRFEGKKGLLIVDPVFQTPYLTRLSLKRIKLYKKLGFSEKKS